MLHQSSFRLDAYSKARTNERFGSRSIQRGGYVVALSRAADATSAELLLAFVEGSKSGHSFAYHGRLRLVDRKSFWHELLMDFAFPKTKCRFVAEKNSNSLPAMVCGGA